MRRTMVLISCPSARSFPRNRRPRLTLNDDGNGNFYYDKASNQRQKRADDDRQHQPTTASNQQSTSHINYLRSWGTRICRCHRSTCSTTGAIDVQSFACSCRWLTKFMVQEWAELDRVKQKRRGRIETVRISSHGLSQCDQDDVLHVAVVSIVNEQ